MFLFNYWTKRDRSDLFTIKFSTVSELVLKANEKGWKVHDLAMIENEVKLGKPKTFHAFPSKINGVLGLEWYLELNFARSAFRELNDHIKRNRR